LCNLQRLSNIELKLISEFECIMIHTYYSSILLRPMD
jgi:hypothetical protein